MKTKQELLKIYSAYLPYELKVKKKFGRYSPTKDEALEIDDLKIFSMHKIFRPHLYSMDMLTKEIEHKGERFIPLHKILEEYCFDLSKMDDEEVLSYAESLIEIDMTVTTYNILLEWHFNVFGLDESEYIKKETT